MPEGSRRDVWVGREDPRATTVRSSRPAPVWAYAVVGILLMIGLVAVVSINHPFLWGFIASMVVAVLAERALDRRTPAWVEGYVVTETVPGQLWFRADRGAAPFALLFLIAVLSAGVFYVGTLLAPIDLTRWFFAFGALIVVGIGYGAVLLVRALRRVDVRLDEVGVTSIGLFGRPTTIPWTSLVAVFPVGNDLLLTTTTGSTQWPGRQLTSDPEIVAEILSRCAELPAPDAAATSAVIDELIAQKRPRR